MQREENHEPGGELAKVDQQVGEQVFVIEGFDGREHQVEQGGQRDQVGAGIRRPAQDEKKGHGAQGRAQHQREHPIRPGQRQHRRDLHRSACRPLRGGPRWSLAGNRGSALPPRPRRGWCLPGGRPPTGSGRALGIRPAATAGENGVLGANTSSPCRSTTSG